MTVITAALALLGQQRAYAQECAQRNDITLDIAIDLSSSMAGANIAAAKSFGVSLIDQLTATGSLVEAGSFTFCAVFIANNQFQDPGAIRTSINNIQVTCADPALSQFDGTALFDAIIAASTGIRTRQQPIKLLVVLTDGLDSASQHTPFEAAAALAPGGIIGRLVFVGPGSVELDSIAAAAGSHVQSIAATSANLNTLVGGIVDATCSNFRPQAAMALSDSDLRLGPAADGFDGFTITFDGSPSSDREDADSALSFAWEIRDPGGAVAQGVSGPSFTHTFDDSSLPGEQWTVTLTVTDTGGASHTATQTFRVAGSPPQVSIDGPTEVEAGQSISLTAMGADPDGGPTPRWRWDIEQAPTGSPQGPQTDFMGGPNGGPATISIPTTGDYVGTWRFRLTGRDDEQAEGTATHTLTIRNLPPEINLDPTSPSQVDVGQTIVITNLTPDDPDGGPVTHSWELLQAPVTAGQNLRPDFQTGETLTWPTNAAAAAGTWIFRLHVTDDEGEEVTEDAQVLVDAQPVAAITGPDQTGSLSQPLELDGSGSSDPDSPSTPPDYGHLHSGPTAVVSEGIAAYRWTVAEVPPELYGTFYPGPVAEVLGLDEASATLHIPGGRLETGDWLFELEVTDGEGNAAYESHWVQVLDESLPPRPVVLQAADFFTTDLASLLAEDVVLDGSLSYDPDNLLTAPRSPGLGITAYLWSYVMTPPTCTTLPTLPTGPAAATADSITLYEAGTFVPPECQGVYLLQLTVLDNDLPIPRSDLTLATVWIGNCASSICIDYPTQLAPQLVKFSNKTDVAVYYHLNSVLYDQPVFTSGLRVRLDVFYQGEVVPTYNKTWDLDLLPSDRGTVLAIHWSGFDNAGRRPRSGRYTIALQLVDASGNLAGYSATEVEAVWIQTVDVAIANSTDKYVDRDGLASGSDGLNVAYTVAGVGPGETGFDQMRYRIYGGNPNTLLHTGSLSGPFTGSFQWNGRLGDGNPLAPGSYTVQLEILENGASLGTSAPYPFTVYRLAIAPVPGPGSPTFPGLYLRANTDDDDRNGTSDLTEQAPGENDLSPLEFSIQPGLAGDLVLSASAPGLVRLYTTAAKAAEVVLPQTYALPANPLPAQLFVEGQTGGQVLLDLEFRLADGTTLGPRHMAITSLDGRVMSDSDNDHAITAADSAAFSVHVARWDNAYDALFNVSNAADPANFMEQDPSRFYLRIHDDAANVDPAARDTITARWATLNDAGLVDDDATEVTLTETGNATREFVSPSLLLVTGDFGALPDDDYAAHDGSAGTVADDAARDRTSHTGIDGRVQVSYTPAGAPSTHVWEVPVCSRAPEERRKAQLRVTVLNEPFNDTGYDHDGNPATPDIGAGNAMFDFQDGNGNMRHDAGEASEPFLDLSTGAAMFGHAGSRGGVVSQAQVDEQVGRATLAWAQACIKLELLATSFNDAPVDVLGNDILADGSFSLGGAGTDEDAVETAYAGMATVDVLEVFLTANIAGATAVSRTPSDMIATLGEKTFVFMEPNLDIDLRTLAHEMGHVLDNGWDAANTQPIFYPALTTYRDNAENSYRRLTDSVASPTVTHCRTVRAIGALAATGNRILKNP